MGNLITTSVTVFAPLISAEYLIPMIMHPHRWGAVPFEPPGPIQYAFLYLLFNLMIIGTFATISGMMTTAHECRKVQFWTAMVNARWSMIFAIIAIVGLQLAPFVKSPILSVVSWLPYANHFVTGLYIAIAVMVGGMIGNGYNRKDVCHPTSAPVAK